jgi:hypothetical protein
MGHMKARGRFRIAIVGKGTHLAVDGSLIALKGGNRTEGDEGHAESHGDVAGDKRRRRRRAPGWAGAHRKTIQNKVPKSENLDKYAAAPGGGNPSLSYWRDCRLALWSWRPSLPKVEPLLQQIQAFKK